MAKFLVNTQNGKSFYLDDKNEIHRGGEGRIILLPGEKEKVAKIYHLGINPINRQRFDQLQKLDKQLFIKPLDLVFQKNNIIGFIMEHVGSDFFPLSSLFSRSFCLRNAITESYKKNIANKLTEALKNAHFNGFIIGDLNQYNVLVNLSSEIKLIDVDSYQTPGHKHSGVLLDDIRDYYYQGNISMNSDYFALSVLLFYLLTYTHPFKGIHKKHKTMADRMINKLPIFISDPLLKIPKCYEPIQNRYIQDKFEKIYMNGERFLFSLDGLSIQLPVKKPVLVTQYNEGKVIVKTVLQNVTIKNVYFSLRLGYIETKTKFIVYSSKDRHYLSKKIELLRSDFEQIYVGNKNIIARKSDKLFHVKEKDETVEITNFKFPENGFCYLLENILVVVSKGQMYWLYLDEVLNHSIRNKRIEVFSEAMLHHNGLIQNTGGVQRIFYHTGKDLATVKVEKNIKQVFQRGNTGLVQYIDNEMLVNQYFKIDGLQLKFVNVQTEVFPEFGFVAESRESGFIFEPDDNKMFIRRTSDFSVISEIKCNKLSRQSSLFYTKAGIIIWERDEVSLINQKE